MKFSTAPQIAPAPNPAAPLAAIVSFETDVPGIAVIDVDDGRRQWTVAFDRAAQTNHSHAVLGLRADTTHRLTVRARDPSGGLAEAPGRLAYRTPPLPADFPPIEVLSCDADKREPGLMVFSASYAPSMRTAEKPGFLVGVDQRGEIVWYYRDTSAIFDVRRLATGNLVYTADDYRLVEIDMLGTVHSTWYPTGQYDEIPPGGIAVETEAIHHAICPLPSGNFLALSIEQRDFDDYPGSDADPDAPPAAAKVIGDVIVEFRRDGTIVKQWKLLDMLDPTRLCYGSFAPFWVMRGYAGTYDWCHANCVIHDPGDDSMLVSLRHQDAVIKVDRATGEVVWIIGDHANWKKPWADKLLTPTDGLAWQYHQHDVSITRDGGILLFDNGTLRATPPSPPTPPAENHSRAVEFAVDEKAMTVAESWAYDAGRDPAYYATFVSGAYRLPITDNVFVTFGGITYTDDGVPEDDNRNHRICARLVEVTRADPAEKVFELKIEDSAAQDAIRWFAFRSEHLPDIYG